MIKYTQRFSHVGLVVVVCTILALFLAFTPTTHATGTGVITGKVFFDDNGNMWLDVSTDSNGVMNSGEEWINGGMKVFITDSNGPTYVWSSSVNGTWSKTVSTLSPVTVTVEATSLNIPRNFTPTTPITHVVNVRDGETVTVPWFGFGPNPNR